jgi:predicted AAA+ superfamily ATPase
MTGNCAWWCCRQMPLQPQRPTSLAIDRANEILKNRGDQPRFKQNRLIFLAADYDSVSRLKDQVRSTLAWQSIVNDIKEMKLNLDQFQSRQASKSLTMPVRRCAA